MKKSLSFLVIMFSFSLVYCQQGYYLKIVKNDAGWLHLEALDLDNKRSTVFLPPDPVGYISIKDTTRFPMKLPAAIGQTFTLIPTMTLFRTPPKGQPGSKPTRGPWELTFYIVYFYQGAEVAVTPRYHLKARNYFDELIKDNVPEPTQNNTTDDGFTIDLYNPNVVNNAALIEMLNKNTSIYNSFINLTRPNHQ